MIRFASSKPTFRWNCRLCTLLSSQSLANSVQPFAFAQLSQAVRSCFATPYFQPAVKHRRPHTHVIGKPFGFGLSFQPEVLRCPDLLCFGISENDPLSADISLTIEGIYRVLFTLSTLLPCNHEPCGTVVVVVQKPIGALDHFKAAFAEQLTNHNRVVDGFTDVFLEVQCAVIVHPDF